jgi:hypothetical protein
MDLSTLAADPGVALKANAENATADAVAILRIVIVTLSDKFEALVYFEQSKSRHTTACDDVTVCFRNAVR